MRRLPTLVLALTAALAPHTSPADEHRWRAVEPHDFGAIVRHGALSPWCDPPCAPETALQLTCQGGPVTWPHVSLSARGEPGRGRGTMMALRIEVEDTTGRWRVLAAVEREVYEWGQWYGVRLDREAVRAVRHGLLARVDRGDGRSATYSLAGSHRAIRRMLDACWAASRRAARLSPPQSGRTP